MSTRRKIIDWAEWDMDYEMVYYPDKYWLDKYFKDSKANSNGKDGRPWCGIWATYVLRLAGLPVRWGPMKGGKKAGWGIVSEYGTQIEIVPGGKGMSMGDVAVVPALNHHFIIVEAVDEYGYIQSLDGNQAFGTIRRLTSHTQGDVQFHYRILV